MKHPGSEESVMDTASKSRFPEAQKLQKLHSRLRKLATRVTPLTNTTHLRKPPGLPGSSGGPVAARANVSRRLAVAAGIGVLAALANPEKAVAWALGRGCRARDRGGGRGGGRGGELAGF